MSKSESWAKNATTRAVMLGNRRRDTLPELRIRRMVHSGGLRYRVDYPPLARNRRLRADLVFTRFKIAVFIDGCFWHGCPQHYVASHTNTEYWGPKMGADKPAKTIIPQVLEGHQLTLEGQPLDVIGLDGPQPDRSFVWIPSIKAVVGGVVVSQNIHLWMADTQGAQSHADWLGTLQRIEKLKPVTVVPGHYLGTPSVKSVAFTADYIKAFDVETAKAKDSAALIAAMKKRYPKLADESSLELSAKVAKGEMQW